MYLKLSGAVLIILTAYLFGFNLSLAYRSRVRHLEEMLLALEMYLTEINYGLTPLPQAFKNIGKRIKLPTAGLFCDAARMMMQNKGLSAYECWNRAVSKNTPALYLLGNDLELVKKLGYIWGKSDKSGQIRQVAFIQELLRQALGEAQKAQEKNDKIWKYLGLLGGMTLVIFLL
jgi:stage III sporulation protein AB